MGVGLMGAGLVGAGLVGVGLPPGASPCGWTARGTAGAEGLADQAVLFGATEEFGDALLVEIEVEHGVSLVRGGFDLASGDVSTFVSSGGRPHRESSVSFRGAGTSEAV